MKAFRIFVLKEFYHIFRDRRTLLILMGMPAVLVVLFGFAITNEIKDARIAIVDPSKDQVSREITERLLSSGYFLLERHLEGTGELLPVFQEGKASLAVVFPADLQNRFYHDRAASVQLLADATDPNTATTLINYATAIINDYQQEILQPDGSPILIDTEVRMLYNPRLKGVFLFVPGVITIILMLVSAMMTSIAITREKELGTMEVLLVSPVRPMVIIIGKVIPYIVLSLINTGIILLLGTTVFGMPIKGSLALLLAECLLFVITALSLGILISTRAATQQVAMMMSMVGLMLPTIILSGFIFPIESMPVILQWLSHIIPAKWFIIIIKDIMLKGVDMEVIWQETLILAGMALFFLAASIRNLKVRLE